MDQYITYHKKPYAKFLSIKQFNATYGTNIREDNAYEKQFQAAYTKARKVHGFDSYLPTAFDTPQAVTVEESKSTMRPVVETKEVSLDDALSDGEDVVEAEYEEAAEAPQKSEEAPQKSEKDEISEIVLSAASDSAAYTQDMRHLIQFRSSGMKLKDQLVKGRPRYMKAIKEYVNGNKDAEIKMSFRKKNKMIKIADLKPKPESLKALLRSQPGEMRVVECL